VSTLLARLGRFLLRVFPSDFRGQFGEDVADYFTTRSKEIREQRGIAGVVRFWVRGAADVMRAAAAERREDRAMQRTPETRTTYDLRLDVRFALRALRRTPGFTLAALLTLALGIGATTAMFSVLDVALRRALPFPDAAELVLGRATFDGNVNPWVAFPDYMDFRDQARSLESLATIGGGSSLVTVTGAEEPEQARFTFVTRNLFETLGVGPVFGSTFSIEELPEGGGGEVVISHGFWQRWFGGSPDVLGRSLIVGGDPVTVMGVMPAGFRFLYDTDLWLPPWAGNSNPVNRRYHNWLVVGRMKPDVSLEEARSEIEVISTQLQEAYPDSNRDKALQLDDLHGAMVEGHRQSLVLLMGAIVLVLLIACGNVASLLMARGSTRTSELAVRAALGAGRFRLARQLLVECVILALVAGGLGVMMAVWLQNLILGFISMDMLGVREGGLSTPMLAVALALSLGTVFLFGVFPSLAAARANPAEELKDGGRASTSGGGVRYRSGLVVLQVALSLILLVGSGLLLRSFGRLRGVDPGFRTENLLTATVSLPSDGYEEGERRIQFFETLKENITALPGVQSVGLVNQLPILHPAGNVAIWAPERPPETNRDAPWADRRIVFPGYFETMQIPLVEGRAFADTDVAEAPAVIILTRTTAEAVFPEEDALGRQVAVDQGQAEPGLFEVVGVVEDHQLSSLSGNARPAMFFPYAQWSWGTMRIAVATATGTASLFRPIQERLWELDRDIVLSEVQTMEAALSNSVADVRSVTTVLGMFAAVAIALVALGLYGVLTFFVSQRMHEIGIRVALGASGGAVLRMVVARGMILVAAGAALGIVGSIGSTRLVEEMLYQTSATDPFTFAGVTGFFLLVALGACLLPAWRALKVDPVEAFRAD
jgi:putative ABC transport system permease protein